MPHDAAQSVTPKASRRFTTNAGTLPCCWMTLYGRTWRACLAIWKSLTGSGTGGRVGGLVGGERNISQLSHSHLPHQATPVCFSIAYVLPSCSPLSDNARRLTRILHSDAVNPCTRTKRISHPGESRNVRAASAPSPSAVRALLRN